PADDENQGRDDAQGVHGPVGGQDREPKPDRPRAREERYPPKVPELVSKFPQRRASARGWCSGSSDHPLQRGGTRGWSAANITLRIHAVTQVSPDDYQAAVITFGPAR